MSQQYYTLVTNIGAARIAKATRGEYSHCEIAVRLPDGQFDCYTSSHRDGGVRCKP